MAVWSVVNMSALYGERRLDAECYRPEILRDANALETFKTVRLGDIATVTDGQHGYHEVDPQSPVRHITAKCVIQGRVDGDNVDRLAKRTHEANKRSQLAVDDILLSTAGRIGEAGLVCADILPANIDQDVARITFNVGAPVSPDFLAVFLNSEFGRFQSERATTGQIQRHISLATLRDFLIPVVSWQAKAGGILRDSIKRAQTAKNLQAEAETILTAALGLDRVDLTPRLFYEDTYAHAAAAARLDAEFFQPQYHRALEAITATKPKRIAPLGEFVSSLTNGHTPLHHDLSQGDIPFLTAEHVFDFRIDYESAKRILRLQHDGELKKTRLCEGDCLITIKGRIGNAAIVEDLPGPVNINQDVSLLRLRSNLPPYYLASYLNSKIGKVFTEQYCTGQINPFLGLGNLRLLPIPTYDDAIMKEIAAKTEATVREAHAARQESRRLLDEAKRTVEAAILKGAKE